ncbi:MAG: radical SAM protein [Alphaproteobacteria bacterium]
MMEKFSNPHKTANNKRRAWVNLTELKTLWFNTGTLCNLACVNCYIESTPKNDRLAYLTRAETQSYLDEIKQNNNATEEIGFTGGEPFMNPDIIDMIEDSLKAGFRTLILTNAMRPMIKCQDELLRLKEQYGTQMTLRISIDHFKREMHEEERGPKSWEPMMKGIKFLSDNNFTIDIAGRTRWGEDEQELRAGFQTFFTKHKININALDKKQLILFPEMDESAPVPEITTECWDILNINPDDMMCASSRMVVKHKGDDKPSVMACTLLAYDPQFNLGTTLKQAKKSVHLNHPHCSKFCVLGGGACSITDT